MLTSNPTRPTCRFSDLAHTAGRVGLSARGGAGRPVRRWPAVLRGASGGRVRNRGRGRWVRSKKFNVNINNKPSKGRVRVRKSGESGRVKSKGATGRVGSKKSTMGSAGLGGRHVGSGQKNLCGVQHCGDPFVAGHSWRLTYSGILVVLCALAEIC